MTSYGTHIDLILLVVGAVVISVLLLYLSYKKEVPDMKSLAIILSKSIVFTIMWQVLFYFLVFVTYTGGTIHEIRIKEGIIYLVSYLIIIVAAFHLEKKSEEID